MPDVAAVQAGVQIPRKHTGKHYPAGKTTHPGGKGKNQYRKYLTKEYSYGRYYLE